MLQWLNTKKSKMHLLMLYGWGESEFKRIFHNYWCNYKLNSKLYSYLSAVLYQLQLTTKVLSNLI